MSSLITTASSTFSLATTHASSTTSVRPLLPACTPQTVPALDNMTQPYCGIPLLGSPNDTSNVSAAMRTCCLGTDFIIPEDGCNIYCSVVGQTNDQLMQCLSTNFGAAKGNTTGILCSSNAALPIRGISEAIVVTALSTMVLIINYTIGDGMLL
jgi:hypothetical protein